MPTFLVRLAQGVDCEYDSKLDLDQNVECLEVAHEDKCCQGNEAVKEIKPRDETIVVLEATLKTVKERPELLHRNAGAKELCKLCLTDLQKSEHFITEWVCYEHQRWQDPQCKEDEQGRQGVEEMSTTKESQFTIGECYSS